jgi:hypothetical protein
MSGNNNPPTLKEIGLAFFETPETNLPEDQQSFQEGLIAEAIRISLTECQVDDEGWRTRHIVSLRNWVRRKLRALIPKLDSPSSEDDIFLQVLREGEGGNLLFLGDVLELAKGNYAPSPTRIIPITEDSSLLISGRPTAPFVRQGLEIHVTGISRTIRASSSAINSEYGVPIQDRAKYVATMGYESFSEEILIAFIEREEKQNWAQAGNWVCYRGNRGKYGFEYSDYYQSVSSPIGYVSIWKTTQGLEATEYWLRIKHQGEDEMVRIPNPIVKHLCLLLDKWADIPRRVVVSEVDSNTIIKTQFPPPEAQIRWIHAVGGRWLGSERHWIRWQIQPETKESTVEVFDKLPVSIKRG